MNEFSMDQPMPTCTVQPEHKIIAIEFANSMIERFSPFECNEILSLIHQRWSEHRQLEIENAEKRISYLRETLAAL
ncbi:MAG: hypothetical protein E6Q97_22820 [Desulfurellales bacterium]|nr:MAG: hypothetical protein E6Q97_22820 [Desulfurellales bacterium]